MLCVQRWHCEVRFHCTELHVALDVLMVGFMRDGVRSITVCDWLWSGQSVEWVVLLQD